jgi:hypothetical protein
LQCLNYTLQVTARAQRRYHNKVVASRRADLGLEKWDGIVARNFTNAGNSKTGASATPAMDSVLFH